jgi:D-psicose/D-tagatose/L-ribulose 3-epimerase
MEQIMTTNRLVGTCTWTFGDMQLTEIAARLQRLNYDGVELMGSLNAWSPSEAATILQDHNLQVFSLTPDNVDLAHPDGTIRAQAVDYYLQLLDFAAGVGNPLVSCHGYVGRVSAISTQAEEYALFVSAVGQIAKRAASMGLRIVIEVLNRYEAHIANTATQTVKFIDDVGADNIGILLDAYHMNIEENNPAEALRTAGDALWLYHAADSNREGIGRGHTDFLAQMAALAEINYQGPTIIECTAPGPNPFTPIKDEKSLAWLETYLQESLAWLRSP